MDLQRFRLAADEAADLSILLGVEGAAAARYLQAWRGLWGGEWGFKGRNRRPPRDPVNALLSLTYSMAQGPVGRLALRHGLDPALGFLHHANLLT